jgi:hypothetical protein
MFPSDQRQRHGRAFVPARTNYLRISLARHVVAASIERRRQCKQPHLPGPVPKALTGRELGGMSQFEKAMLVAKLRAPVSARKQSPGSARFESPIWSAIPRPSGWPRSLPGTRLICVCERYGGWPLNSRRKAMSRSLASDIPRPRLPGWSRPSVKSNVRFSGAASVRKAA